MFGFLQCGHVSGILEVVTTVSCILFIDEVSKAVACLPLNLKLQFKQLKSSAKYAPTIPPPPIPFYFFYIITIAFRTTFHIFILF